MQFSTDRSTVDALSWRLASELLRRHPHLSLNRGHPGGGMYDCLMIASSVSSPNIFLNRVATIQIHGRFDGGESDWRAATWELYLHADPKEFLLALEASAGLMAPQSVPATTGPVLLYRVFAALSALSSKSTHPYAFEQGYIDSSGDDAGPNSAVDAFSGGFPPAAGGTRPGAPR